MFFKKEKKSNNYSEQITYCAICNIKMKIKDGIYIHENDPTSLIMICLDCELKR